jgi:hypothetical protein
MARFSSCTVIRSTLENLRGIYPTLFAGGEHQLAHLLIFTRPLQSDLSRLYSVDSPASSSSANPFIGRALTIQFKFDFVGWTEVCGENVSQYENEDIYETLADVVPLEFYEQRPHPRYGTHRGFRGRLTAPGHPFDAMHVVAATIDGMPVDGKIDFSVVPNPRWRFWMSHEELPLPTLSFRQLRVADLIAGHGILMAKTTS